MHASKTYGWTMLLYVILGSGLVLGKEQGALPKMLTPFKWGLGGKLGNGQQYISWIDINDVVHIIDFALDHQNISGPINLVAPSPCTNLEFTKILGRILNRPTFMGIPAVMIRLILGEMSQLLLDSSRCIPQKLDEAGYEFLYPSLESSLLKNIDSKN